MFTVFFTDGPVVTAADARRCDTKAYARFFNALRKRGVLFPPSQFEAAFLSFAHAPRDLTQAARAIGEAFGA
jgi:glutamate-1-semialdehyde 2,1-aminomutase